MPSLNTQQENTLTAFITALSEQDEPLPPSLQRQLHAIGQNLEHRIVELAAIAASLPRLSRAYQDALNDEQTKTEVQDVTFVSTSKQDHQTELISHASGILTDSDPVKAAQKELSPTSGLIASNPLKRLFRRG